ncbi:SpaA isopeptide-forming pilin-related protein [Enterococcus faecalis]|uniref:SpaA isopeptide-forming pilin-related protein n=1 Tax=Enterococcus faecalis TaxID=1351 RepID=UPI0025AF3413|nr:SpaA isopeptide-forming pilin-related protein [Enterococcus faecalis]
MMLGVLAIQTVVSVLPVHAITASDVRYDHDNLREMSVTYNGETKSVVTAPIYLNRGTGEELVFCVDPFTLVEEGGGYSSNPFILNRKANLISSLWEYAGKDWNTYFVAQEMMYNEIGANVHSNGELTNEQRKEIKTTIIKTIEKYEKKPSFHNQTINLTLGETTVIEDRNGSLLSQFDTETINTANVDWKLDGNKLFITPKKESKESGTLFIEKSLKRGTPYIWKKANSQDLSSAGVSDPAYFQLNFKIEKEGKLKISKRDKDSGKPIPGTKFDVSYNGKKQTVEMDKNGDAVLEGLPHDAKTKVTETFVPAPYVLDKNNTKEVVIKAGKTATVEFKNTKATGKSTLTKIDKTTENATPLNPLYPMEGAKYGWFKADGTLIKEFTLGKDLKATIDKQELGSYFWQETQAPTGYVLDPTKHMVELTYKDQNTAVVVGDATSKDDVIRMNLDGQKLIQNATNEMLKNDVEFTLTNLRTEETQTEVTKTVDGKKGYFRFADLMIDNYRLDETKGVEGYNNVDPMLITHSYDKETDTFTFVVTDEKSGNVLNTEQLSQEELAKGENVDLGTYTLKDKATPTETPWVDIVSLAHAGDGKTRSFVWGEDVTLYDDVKISHKNIPLGTERAFEDILVAVTPDNQEKDVWTSGKIEYKVANGNMTQRVETDYDYKKDPEGTRYFFKVIGYTKVSDTEYKQDVEHNFDGNQKNQEIVSTLSEKPEVSISTQAHTGDNKTQTFIWGDLVTQYDDVKISHKHIAVGTERAFETILVAVTPDDQEKDVWTSGKVAYKISDKETIQTVKADYDYRKDPKGTRYYFKEIGYSKTKENKYEKDSEHNFDGKEKTQDIIPTIKEVPKEEPKTPSDPKQAEHGLLPQTGEKGSTLLLGFGVIVLGCAYVLCQYKKRKKIEE